ncbi:MAG: class I SAM-dependent methyltransferase [Patescibacteria group bacterium]
MDAGLINKYVNFKNPAKILDIGFGSGKDSVYFAQNGFDVDAIDFDDEKISVFKKRIGHLKNINIIYENLLDFEFPQNHYDVILANHVLDFIRYADFQRIIRKIHNALKLDGIFFLAIFNISDPFFNKLSEKNLRRPENNSFLINDHDVRHFYTKSDIEFMKKFFEIEFFEEESVDDNHGPTGKHHHNFFRIVAKKVV